jgi:Peptidase M10 serralysin C terminal
VAVGSTTVAHFTSQAVISIDTSVAGFGPITNNFNTYGGYPYETLVHEEGHLIGLGHGGPYNGSVNTSTQQFSAYDTRLWTLMSYINPSDTSAKYYSSYPVTGTNWGGHYATTPMILDILAAQELYGPATSGPLTVSQTFGFNTTITGSIQRYFDFTTNTNPVITIWDSAAHNTLDVSGWNTPSSINLNQGTFSSTNGETNNIGIAVGTVIDKAIGGSGNDIFNANNAGDTLIGNGGVDTYAFSLSGWGVAHVIDTLGQIVFTGASALAAVAGKFYEAVSGSDFVLTYWPNGSEIVLQGVSSPQSWTYGYASAAVATASNWATIAFSALAGTPPDLTASGFSLNGLTASYQINNIGTGTVPATTTGI